LDGITQATEVPDAGRLYQETDRPQFHFTSRRGWLNDPNGLVWLDSEYHLYYQHNPYGWDWGNMQWGHAVSRDLVRWTELPIALYPRAYGDLAFSGSAVVDRRNSSGFGPEGSSPIVGAYTSTGRGECIIYSLDKGRTWTEFAGNPVVKHAGRDPRLLWHEPTRRWVMAVYDEEGGKRSIAFHSSPDLKAWTYESKIEGFFECPDLFELPIEGEPGGKLWVLSAADGQYMLGGFDGHRFNPESGKHRTWHGNFYAAQSFSDEPDGERIQIGWAQGIAFPGMPFNQQMTVPCELTLRPTDEGVRMFAIPVEEVDSLRVRGQRWTDVKPADDPVVGPSSDLLSVRIDARMDAPGSISLSIPGATVAYDASKRLLSCGNLNVPMGTEDGRLRLRILVDRAPSRSSATMAGWRSRRGGTRSERPGLSCCRSRARRRWSGRWRSMNWVPRGFPPDRSRVGGRLFEVAPGGTGNEPPVPRLGGGLLSRGASGLGRGLPGSERLDEEFHHPVAGDRGVGRRRGRLADRSSCRPAGAPGRVAGCWPGGHCRRPSRNRASIGP